MGSYEMIARFICRGMWEKRRAFDYNPGMEAWFPYFVIKPGPDEHPCPGASVKNGY